MANYFVHYAKHATLTGSVVDTINLTQPASYILVTNRSISGTPIYFNIGDTLDTTPDPVAAGDNTFGIAPGITIQVPFDGSQSVVKIISADPQSYSVMVV
jgi:hypothetical protein